MSANPDSWPEQDILTLRQLWAEGHSMSEIGRRMKRSKNSIMGKSKRIGCPARPNPIATKHPNYAFWTAEQDAFILKRRDQGATYVVIAAELTAGGRKTTPRTVADRIGFLREKAHNAAIAMRGTAAPPEPGPVYAIRQIDRFSIVERLEREALILMGYATVHPFVAMEWAENNGVPMTDDATHNKKMINLARKRHGLPPFRYDINMQKPTRMPKLSNAGGLLP